MKSKKWFVLFLVLSVLLLFTGCKRVPDTETLYSSDFIRVESTGAETVVFDLKTDDVYSFRHTRERVKKGNPGAEEVQPLIDTDTLQVEAIKGHLIIRETESGKAVFV